MLDVFEMMKIGNKFKCIGILTVFSAFVMLFSLCSSNKERAMEAQITATLAQLNISYFTDGAGGSDITETDKIVDLVRSKKEKLLPVLIDSLSNSSTTNSVLNDSENVPLGYVCFDLLCSIVQASYDWYYLGCGDDGLWACVREEYYIPVSFNAENMNKIKRAQNNWRNLLESSRLKLETTYQ